MSRFFSQSARTTVALLLALTLVGGGCGKKSSTTSTTSSVSTAPSAPLTGSNLSSVDAGRAIYTGKCTDCHSAQPIDGYSTDNWTGNIIPSMARKAGLTADEKQALTDYILSVKNAGS